MSGPAPLRVERSDTGLWQAVLNGPPANLLTLSRIEALTALFEEAARTPRLKGIVLSGEGGSFCYGASVEEHLPGLYQRMIPAFGRLFQALLRSRVACLAAVRGQCLGGGLELVLPCHRVVISPDARMGQPEIRLGVIAPAAAALLAERVGQVRADDLLLTGRLVQADEALRIGLADEIAGDPLAAAIAWAETHLLPRSASSLRIAIQAGRSGMIRRFRDSYPEIERLYLDELMGTADAVEGLRAFLEKRPPVWSDR